MMRVLHIVNHLSTGGIQSFLINIYRNINQDEIQFDFLLQRRFYNELEQEVLDMGGKIFVVPSRREGLSKRKKALINFFDEHPEYRAVHMHISSLTDILPLAIAKKKGVKVRVVHSHNTRASGSKIHTVLHKINKKRIGKVATDFYACSDLAADWFYGGESLREKAVVLPNGIDCFEYKFNEGVRDEYRKQFGWEGKTVLGHVGRVQYAKNHEYLVDIFNEYLKVDLTAVLAIVGDGDLLPNVKAKVKALGIEDNVNFLGNRSDVAQLLQAFDLFLLPSHYEGFPVTMVEAQAAGLYCVASEAITPTSDLADAVTFCSITQSAKNWTKPIQEAINKSRNLSAEEKIKKAGFDVKDVAEVLCKRYKEAY